jgi:hypothetical protein
MRDQGRGRLLAAGRDKKKQAVGESHAAASWHATSIGGARPASSCSSNASETSVPLAADKQAPRLSIRSPRGHAITPQVAIDRTIWLSIPARRLFYRPRRHHRRLGWAGVPWQTGGAARWRYHIEYLYNTRYSAEAASQSRKLSETSPTSLQRGMHY